MTIGEKITEIKSELPAGVSLVAVSKFHPAEAIREAYVAGQRIFGESRVQELLSKIPELPADIKWHFIGHLQTNKVKQLIGKTTLIESVDTERLLNIIDTESAKADIVTRVLMQIHVAKEETKFGFSPEELLEYFREKKYNLLKATHICGVMGMASNVDDRNRILSDFHEIRKTFNLIRELCPDLEGFNTVSMGMSHDWRLAVDEGSTSVRIGSAIFGERHY